MKNDEEVVRAYSMASYPAEGRRVMLNVRVATPPWDRAKNAWADVNPGVALLTFLVEKQEIRLLFQGLTENSLSITLKRRCYISVVVQEWHQCVHTFMSYSKL